MRPPDDLDRLREEHRRLWAAAPGGTWAAPQEQALPGALISVDGKGNRSYLGSCFYGQAVSALAASARNALPVLWKALDDARRQQGVPVLGTVGDEGKIAWSKSR